MKQHTVRKALAVCMAFTLVITCNNATFQPLVAHAEYGDDRISTVESATDASQAAEVTDNGDRGGVPSSAITTESVSATESNDPSHRQDATNTKDEGDEMQGLSVAKTVFSEVASKEALQPDLASYVTTVTLSLVQDGSEIKEGAVVTYGDAIYVTVAWEFPDTVDPVKKNDTFTYALPANITFENKDNGKLMEGDKAVGAYTIRDSMLTISYTQDMGSSVQGQVRFSGTIGGGDLGPEGNPDTTFEFPGVVAVNGVQVDPKPIAAELKISKTSSEVTGEPFQNDFVIKLEAIGSHTGVVLDDKMGSYLSLSPVDGNLVIYEDEACTTLYTGSYSKTDGTVFPLMFDSLENTTLYVKYRVDINKAALAATDSKRKNTAHAKSTEYPKGVSTGETDVKLAPWTVKKEGAREGDKAVWTITVDPGNTNADIAGTKIKDNLGFTLGNGDVLTVEVFERDRNSTDANAWGPSPLSASWDELTSDAGFVFPQGSSKSYQFKLSTSLASLPDQPEFGSKNYKNDVSVFPFGVDTSINASGSVRIDSGHPAVTFEKVKTDFDRSSKQISWETRLSVPGSTGDPALTSVVLEDTLDQANPQTLVWGAAGEEIEITDAAGIAYDPSAYSIEQTAQDGRSIGFKITFNKPIPAGTTLKLAYRSIIDESRWNDVYTFKNSAVLKTSNAETQESTAQWQYVGQHLKKEDVTTANPFTGVLDWKLTVRHLQADDLNATSVTVVDTLPENMSFIEESLKAPSGLSAQPSNDGKTVTFAIEGDALATLKNDTRDIELSIFYSTRLIDPTIAIKGAYENKAQMHIGDRQDVEITSTTKSYDPPQLVGKSYTYTSDTAPFVEYEITVNPDARDLDKSSNTLKLVDQMKPALDLRMDSLTVSTDTIADTSIRDMTDQGFGYDFDHQTRTLSIDVPDETAITLKYKARISLEVGDELSAANAANDIVLTGIASNAFRDSKALAGRVLQSSGSSESKGYSITVYKYAKGKTSDPLAGARFKVEQVEVDKSNANAWAVTGTQPVGAEFESEANGYASGPKGLLADHVYRIVEVAAPVGYALAEPYYVVFDGNTGVSYENIEVFDEQGSSHVLTSVHNKKTLECFINNDPVPEVSVKPPSPPQGTPPQTPQPHSPQGSMMRTGDGLSGWFLLLGGVVVGAAGVSGASVLHSRRRRL